MSGLKKEAKQLSELIAKRGYEISTDGRGHYEVIDPETHARLYSFPKTPSDHRWRVNAVGDMRRLGILENDPRKEGQMAAEPRVNEASAKAGNRLRAMLSQFGWEDGKRSPHVSEFARLMLHVGETQKLRVPPSEDAAKQNVWRLVRGENVQAWVVTLVNAALDNLSGRTQDTASAARDADTRLRFNTVQENLRRWFGTHDVSQKTAASRMITIGTRKGLAVFTSPEHGQAALSRFLANGGRLPGEYLPIVEEFLAADGIVSDLRPVETTPPETRVLQPAELEEAETRTMTAYQANRQQMDTETFWGDEMPLHIKALTLMAQSGDVDEAESIARQILDLELRDITG